MKEILLSAVKFIWNFVLGSKKSRALFLDVMTCCTLKEQIKRNSPLICILFENIVFEKNYACTATLRGTLVSTVHNQTLTHP